MNLSIFNSNKAPRAFLIAFTLAVLTVSVGGCYLYQTNALPAPMFTGRFSLDEKIRFMRMNDSYDVNFIAIGSSAGLNNLSSEVMRNVPEAKNNYFNFSTWGLTNECILTYWGFVEEIANPRKVILFIDLLGFQMYPESKKLVINEADLKDYLKGGYPLWHYVKYHKLGLVERIRHVGRRRITNNSNDSLLFDKQGGVVLEIPEDKITRTHWNEDVNLNTFVEGGYDALDDLLKTFSTKGIQVILVQGPIRGQYSDSDPKYDYLQKHWEHVASIAGRNNTTFLNMRKLFSSQPEFFADAAHLNKDGARLFTRKLVEQLKERGFFMEVSSKVEDGK